MTSLTRSFLTRCLARSPSLSYFSRACSLWRVMVVGAQCTLHSQQPAPCPAFWLSLFSPTYAETSQYRLEQLRRRLTSMHRDRRPIHEAALLAREEEHDFCNLGWLCGALEGDRVCSASALSLSAGEASEKGRGRGGKGEDEPVTADWRSGGKAANMAVSVAPGWMQFERMPAAYMDLSALEQSDRTRIREGEARTRRIILVRSKEDEAGPTVRRKLGCCSKRQSPDGPL